MLSEINTYNAKKSPSPIADTTVSPTTDTVNLSQTSELMNDLKQLQTSDPAEFKQVLSDAATQLKTAAGQQTDPGAASFLSKLSDRFQKAADTGDLSALKPTASAGGSYRPHHHGHHAKPATDADASTATDPTSLMNTVTQSLTATPASQTGAQVQSLLSTLFSTTP